ncbi:hypothetical protein K7432_018461 [Basidiobolus ranarum]|uniref:Uncharacterized protein n=1 Tax=Basidiobolus ranarum TaxID=34480 RepID=A0ABR2WC60_9FUNG
MFSAVEHLQQTQPALFKPVKKEVNNNLVHCPKEYHIAQNLDKSFTSEQLRLAVEKAYYSIASGSYKATIEGQVVECIFDTGSEINAIKGSVFKSLNLPSTGVS